MPAIAPPVTDLAQVSRPLPRPKHGLLDVATIVRAERHLLNGVEYWAPEAPQHLPALPLDCDNDPDDAWPSGIDTITDLPFRLRAGWRCSNVGFTDAEINQRATAMLDAGEAWSVEAAVWERITDPTVADLPAGTLAQSIATTVGVLEAWLYTRYAGVGVLHVPRSAITAFVDADAIRVDCDHLVTVLGTPVSAGAYPNAGPTTAGTGNVWIAVTGAVTLHRSDIAVHTRNHGAHFDPTTNEIAGVAERVYIPSFDGVAAVGIVDLPSEPVVAAANYPAETNYPGYTNFPSTGA